MREARLYKPERRLHTRRTRLYTQEKGAIHARGSAIQAGKAAIHKQDSAIHARKGAIHARGYPRIQNPASHFQTFSWRNLRREVCKSACKKLDFWTFWRLLVQGWVTRSPRRVGPRRGTERACMQSREISMFAIDWHLSGGFCR